MSAMTAWNYSIFWQEAINQLRQEFREQSKEQEFSLWFAVEYIGSEQSKILVGVPSSFFRDQMKIRGYINLLQDKIHELSGQAIELEFVITPHQDKKNSASTQITDTIPESKRKNSSVSVPESLSAEPIPRQTDTKKHPQLNTKYSFNSFVMGDNNSFAYNAASAIAKNPGHAYNPFLIYGGVGLGKTHLMQAIGNYVYDEKKLKVIYITAEDFTNEFIQAINEKTTQKFKNKYRTADVLLIDDIHFLQNKDQTQEELFHTFNALYDSYKQIVFTCDRPVSELKNLTERLKSRFERGLNVDLQPPKYETRHAILEKKLELAGKKIDDAVIDLIAQNVSTNVRDLEACLTKLIAYTDLIHKEITVEIAQQQLRDTFSSPKSANINIEVIQRVVSDYFSISYSDLRGKKRTKNVMLPRQLAMYIARELTEYSTTELGMEFGGRDHTTVMHSCQKIEEQMRSDSTLYSTVQILIRSIKDYKK
jgi:chromosomal replication initiator protein